MTVLLIWVGCSIDGALGLQRRLSIDARRIVATGKRTINWRGTASPERGEAKISQLIDGRLWLLGAVDHEPRIIKLNASGPHQNRLAFAILDLKLSTAIALGYDFGQRFLYILVVFINDRPIFIERRFEEFVQFAMGLETLRIRLFERCHGGAQLLAGLAGIFGDILDRGFDFAQEAASDRLVDFGPRREKPKNVGQRHLQFVGDICNRGFLKLDLAEQMLGAFHNDPTRISLFR
jgi:hypothetical protein